MFPLELAFDLMWRGLRQQPRSSLGLYCQVSSSLINEVRYAPLPSRVFHGWRRHIGAARSGTEASERKSTKCPCLLQTQQTDLQGIPIIEAMGAAVAKQHTIVPEIFSEDGPGQTIKAKRRDVIYRIGDPSDGVYFISRGRVRLSVTNAVGKEATLALLGPNDLFGEHCLLLGRKTRSANAYAECATDLVKVNLKLLTKSLSSDLPLAHFFMKRAILRMAEYEHALAYQITNNTERRLARALLHLSHYDSGTAKPVVIQDVSQEMLSNMVGANRSRLNGFMTKFRRLGHIEYGGGYGDTSITVNPSLVSVLFDSPEHKKQRIR